MDEEAKRLINKYSQVLQDFQKKCQALTYSLQRACELIAGEEKKDQTIVYNCLVQEGQNKVEVLYGRDKESN